MSWPLLMIYHRLEYIREFASRRNGGGQDRRPGEMSGRPSGECHHAGQPINALTAKMVLRFFVVSPIPEKRAWGWQTRS